ncbi:hypothetical protein C6501_05180 [Candidatus Poribacteria bacterium]|nr:MAG: hypothetical protein C6501_05180 [Candidatus Poribacteria bacterium]
MKTQFWLKIGLTALLIVFMGVGLLFGTIKMIDVTQADTFDCKRIRLDCIPRGEKPICPDMNLTPRCPLDAAKER